MSRAYKIKVAERTRVMLRASDRVSTHLEMLEILPCERMAELLAQELKERGFADVDGKLVRVAKDGIVVEIDPAAGEVIVRVDTKTAVTIEGEKQVWSEREPGTAQESETEALRQALLKDLQREAETKRAQLQKETTDRLEAHLAGLRKELDQVTNRVTAAALKEKAAQIGHIKQVTEDAQSGSLTIVLEV